MPPSNDHIHEWFVIAEKDLVRASKRAKEADWEGAGFRIQQSVEKFFKGYLALNGCDIHFTHDLEVLLDEIVEINDKFEIFREACQRITSYYMGDRYPKMMEEPLTEDDIIVSLKWAEKIKEMIQTR